MAVTRYRRFLKLCEEWPVEETKRGRDLGTFLRQRVAQAFREGENTQIADPVTCDEMFESLSKIHTNYYKNKVSSEIGAGIWIPCLIVLFLVTLL
ncbi:ubiquinol-cytochrome-c reductase complex assembly factor 2 [Sphaerodactylus townsendi]|uniref:ubiquinol-cytochrome-c reductase complex assembly factor 2 n=1 Tax=Sphaerodactylus townsendi TaxID=933632 RepID=UPI0020262891|nr:ubiquinol-cytochrome-c reductase complex assembly factor 2 [Sphaerodactylus townsendi]